MSAPALGLRSGLRGLLLVLAADLLIFAVLWARRSPEVVDPQPPPPAVAQPELPPASDLDRAWAAALASPDPSVAAEARLHLSAAARAPALAEAARASCDPAILDAIELLAADSALQGAEAYALAVAALDARGEDPACGGATLRTLDTLQRSTALDGGAAVRLAEDALKGLPPGDLRAVGLIALIDRAAPEGSGWPARLEALALDEELAPTARAVACLGVVRRRIAPRALLARRRELPGPVQGCLLDPQTEDRVASARDLVSAEDVDVRLGAVAILHAFGGPEDVPILLDRLRGAPGRRERAALVEAAGYLVQLHHERANELAPLGAPPGSPEALARARAEAGVPSPPGRLDGLCDVVAEEPGPLQPWIDRTAALGSGARLCLPAGSHWTGDAVGPDQEIVLLALGPASLDGALRLPAPSVVVGLVPRSLSAPPGSVLLWTGAEADGALSIDAVLVAPGEVTGAPIVAPEGIEPRGDRGGARGWVRRDALAPALPPSPHGPPPERAPRSAEAPPAVALAAPAPAPEARGDTDRWVPVYGEGDVALLVPLRAGAWSLEGPALLLMGR